ncbi:MAG: protein kinase [Proteobacteria bacterium]|nr:protein kinase [Pseudomonadota bacterium]
MSQTQVLPLAHQPAAAGLARLAFAAGGDATSAAIGPRHLAFLPPEALELDLDDPAQRDFGEYELLEKVGHGGMGVVYRARQKALDREVALKLLAAGPWASTDFIQRFRLEAQSAARMEHPNIVTVYETGSYEELHYFSMRLVRGQSLAAHLRQSGPYAPLVAARLIRTVAEAVDYAHRLGVLHLDLKPGNILIDAKGEPLVADFGLARRLDDVLAEQADEVSGTPSYMAPEQAQAQAQRIGVATDVYGIGAILYELLTGVPPFRAATAQETLARVVNESLIPPSERRAGIPLDLQAICLKCLAKDPADRYASARLLDEDLARFLDGRPVSVRRLNMPQRVARWAKRDPRLAWALAVSLLTLIVGLLATSFQWQRAETSAKTSRGLLWDSRREAALSLERGGDGFAALSKLLANLVEEEHAGAQAAATLDRRHMGMLQAQGAQLIDRIAIADANPLATAISPDGTLLALAFNDQSVRWYDTATLTERGRVSLRDVGSSDGENRAVSLLRFVDDHRLRATLQWYGNWTNPSNGDTWLIDLDHARRIDPPPAFADFASAAYSADGDYALLIDHQHGMQFWRTNPWRPDSDRFTNANTDGQFYPWLIDPAHGVAAYLTQSLRQLELYDLPDIRSRHTITFPGNAGISAWALSRDGRTLALGDFEGRSFLLDTRTRALRLLPRPRGREITWMAFSEDDAWVAIASFDGAVDAYDVASGDPLVAGRMQQDFNVRRVAISHAQQMLVAAGDGRVALWRLPLPGPRAIPAQRIALAPAAHGQAGQYAIDWSLATGLLASTGTDGQIRLWRLPAPLVLPGLAARQRPDRLDFDGQHLLQAAWNRVRLIAPDGHGLSPWLELPQPPGFALPLDAGRELLVTTGPQLRGYDSATRKPLFAPVALPDSPERLLVSPDDSRVLLSFGASSDHGFVEHMQLYDARHGQRLRADARSVGPYGRLAFSRDGSRLLAIGPPSAQTEVFDGKDLHRIGALPNDPYQPVQWGDFDADGSVWLVTRAGDTRLGSDVLIHWDPASHRVLSKQSVAQAAPLGVLPTKAGVFVFGSHQDVLATPQGVRPLGATGVDMTALSTDATAQAVASPDGRLVARAFRNEVRVYDAATGAQIGLPQHADIAAMDVIVQLAFSADADRLLALTQFGHWVLWPIPPEVRKADAIAAALAHLDPGNESQQVVNAPLPSERASLRASDPGPWRSPEPVPSPPMTTVNSQGIAVPMRAADTSPFLLDLAAWYQDSPDAMRNTFFRVEPGMRPFPAGVQRIAGTDFDMRGMLMINKETGAMECVPTPPRIAALRLLMEYSSAAPVASGDEIGRLVLHYADGGSAALPLRAGRELPGYGSQDDAVPFAFATDNLWALYGLPDSKLIEAPRLANPEPQRAVRCVDLVSDRDNRPMLVYAITAEPAATAAGATSAATAAQTTSSRPIPGH